jgi:hypothetical protein
MSKFTPGPWGWYRGFLVTARRDGTTGLDAKVIMKEAPDFFNDADSALIAAAPEMLEALLKFGDAATDVFEQMDMGKWADELSHDVGMNQKMIDLREAVLFAMQAIAKAKGEK